MDNAKPIRITVVGSGWRRELNDVYSLLLPHLHGLQSQSLQSHLSLQHEELESLLLQQDEDLASELQHELSFFAEDEQQELVFFSEQQPDIMNGNYDPRNQFMPGVIYTRCTGSTARVHVHGSTGAYAPVVHAIFFISIQLNLTYYIV